VWYISNEYSTPSIAPEFDLRLVPVEVLFARLASFVPSAACLGFVFQRACFSVRPEHESVSSKIE
jgi:hypothetical protein